MKAAEIAIGGMYIAKVERYPRVVVVLSTGKTDWHKYPRTAYNCKVVRTGEHVRFTDVKRFQRVAREDEIEKAKGE